LRSRRPRRRTAPPTGLQAARARRAARPARRGGARSARGDDGLGARRCRRPGAVERRGALSPRRRVVDPRHLVGSRDPSWGGFEGPSIGRGILAGTALARGPGMLKITALQADGPVARLRIEGRVTGEAIAEVEAACTAARGTGQPVVLDLTGVTFADRDGVA